MTLLLIGGGLLAVGAFISPGPTRLRFFTVMALLVSGFVLIFLGLLE